MRYAVETNLRIAWFGQDERRTIKKIDLDVTSRGCEREREGGSASGLIDDMKLMSSWLHDCLRL